MRVKYHLKLFIAENIPMIAYNCNKGKKHFYGHLIQIDILDHSLPNDPLQKRGLQICRPLLNTMATIQGPHSYVLYMRHELLPLI